MQTAYYRKSEVAKLLRVSTRSVENYVRKGKLISVKFGKYALFPADQFPKAKDDDAKQAA